MTETDDPVSRPDQGLLSLQLLRPHADVSAGL